MYLIYNLCHMYTIHMEKEMATHSNILAWRIPWTRSLVNYSPWGQKESDTTEVT